MYTKPNDPTIYITPNNYMTNNITVMEMLKDENYVDIMFKRFRCMNYLNILRTISNKKDIFILPINYFEDYKDKLSDFLNIKIDSSFPNKNRSSIKDLLHKKRIEIFIEKNDYLLDLIDNDLREVDKNYNSNLFKYYSTKR